MFQRLVLVCGLLIAAMAAHAGELMPVEPVVIQTDKGEFSFNTEIARSLAQRQKGLMFRRKMADDAAMLFYWGKVQPVSMWMKNTFIPLDMVFIAADGKVTGIARNTVPQSLEVISSPGAVAAVLEIKAGISSAIGLKTGDLVRHKIFIGGQ